MKYTVTYNIVTRKRFTIDVEADGRASALKEAQSEIDAVMPKNWPPNMIKTIELVDVVESEDAEKG